VLLAKELSLTGRLADQDAIAIALQSYEERRADRASEIVLKSRGNGEALKATSVKLAIKQRALSMLPASKLRADAAQSIQYDV
jgi:hypothetical protein